MSIMIGLPCGGGNVSEQTTIGLFNLGKEFVRNDIPHSILSLSNSSLISQGRSRIVNFFLNNTDHEYLFFLDSDIGFQKEDVMKLSYRNLQKMCMNDRQLFGIKCNSKKADLVNKLLHHISTI